MWRGYTVGKYFEVAGLCMELMCGCIFSKCLKLPNSNKPFVAANYYVHGGSGTDKTVQENEWLHAILWSSSHMTIILLQIYNEKQTWVVCTRNLLSVPHWIHIDYGNEMNLDIGLVFRTKSSCVQPVTGLWIAVCQWFAFVSRNTMGMLSVRKLLSCRVWVRYDIVLIPHAVLITRYLREHHCTWCLCYRWGCNDENIITRQLYIYVFKGQTKWIRNILIINILIR